MGNNTGRSSEKTSNNKNSSNSSACCGSVQYAPNSSEQARSKLKRKSVPVNNKNNLTPGDFYQNMIEGTHFFFNTDRKNCFN